MSLNMYHILCEHLEVFPNFLNLILGLESRHWKPRKSPRYIIKCFIIRKTIRRNLKNAVSMEENIQG